MPCWLSNPQVRGSFDGNFTVFRPVFRASFYQYQIVCCAWRKIRFSTKHSKSLSVHRFSYLLIYFTLCASPCVCTGLVTHSVAHILFSSELPLSLCKGSSVNPNLLNNKVEQIVSKLEQVLRVRFLPDLVPSVLEVATVTDTLIYLLRIP